MIIILIRSVHSSSPWQKNIGLMIMCNRLSNTFLRYSERISNEFGNHSFGSRLFCIYLTWPRTERVNDILVILFDGVSLACI